MKYAIISDIHGNMPALKAVLEDAENVNVDRYIFAGDYYFSLPFPNDVVNAIRIIKDAYVICGNEEGYIKELSNQNKQTWTDGQFCALYWCLNEMTIETKDYLANLPKELEIIDSDVLIRVFHSPKSYFDKTKIIDMESVDCALAYKNNLLEHKNYSDIIHESLNTDPTIIQTLNSILDGIYIFGHYHIQWNMQIGNILLINPGSCGLPVDYIPNAPYTILEIKGGEWKVEERRIKYDINTTIESLKNSELYRQAKIWSDIIISELRTNREHAQFFLNHVENYAKEINDNVRPYSHKTWVKAYEIWQEK